MGWDPVSGQSMAHPALKGLPRDISEITASPRKYGLHGTIKPPFHLAEGKSAEGLSSDFESLCSKLAPIRLNGLVLARLENFIALKVNGDQKRLANLAATVVCELDTFRAPPSKAELARRRKANLSASQEALLTRWGYPYVLNEFRFHLTLTGCLGTDVETTIAALAPRIEPLLERPFKIDSLTLVGEDTNGMFHEVHRQNLSG
ncbi:Protein of unknown function [Shimia sagamensis]|uniref:Phosphonate metabolism protein n=2 Tax=Shimia sagamensis TaxID=1566352 RepID=A0ABY1PMK0_9RHOB|nr:Protein of unknown function [Shimia sagamensis]